MNLANLEFHKLADYFPLLNEEETGRLADNIKAVGLKEPLMLLEGKVLDGRNRFRACQEAGYKLKPEDVILYEEQEFADQDPVEYVIAKNIRRRHMTIGQRQAILAELVNLLPKAPAGRPPSGGRNTSEHSEVFPSKTEKTASMAQAAGVSLAGVQTASHILNAAPDLHEEVKQGRMSMNEAKKEERKRTKPKPTPDEHDQAWERIEKICGSPFVHLIQESKVPGLGQIESLVAFAKLGDKEMQELRQPLYRAYLSLAHARKVLDRKDPTTGVLRPDWTWTHQETAALMAEKERQILKRVMDTPKGTLIVALVFANPDKEDLEVKLVPTKGNQKKSNDEKE